MQPSKPAQGKLGQNVVPLGMVSFLTDVSSEMIFPILPIFLTSVLGAGKEILGLIEGVADSISSLVEIISGYWSDVSGKRKQLVLLGYGTSSFVKLGIALSTSWVHVLFFRGLERIGKGIRTAPRDAIIASSSDPSARGKAFGLHRAMDTLGAILGPLFAFWLLSSFGSMESGYRTVFLFALIPAFLAVAVLALFVKEPDKSVAAKKRPAFWDSLRQLGPKYKSFLKVSLLFSLSYFSFAFLIVRATDSGLGVESVTLLYVLYNIVYASVSVPIGALSDRMGRKNIIAAAFALYALICLGFAFASLPWHFVLLFAAYGVFVSADESVNKAYISEVSPEEKRGIALGAYNTAIGAAYLPASVITGALWASFGMQFAFGAAAALALVSAAALYFRHR